LAPHAPIYTLPAQPEGRGQHRRALETPGHGPRSCRGYHERETGFWSVGTDLPRRVRQKPTQACAGEDYWGVKLLLRGQIHDVCVWQNVTEVCRVGGDDGFTTGFDGTFRDQRVKENPALQPAPGGRFDDARLLRVAR